MSISNGRWGALAGFLVGAGLVACSASGSMDARPTGRAGASAVSSAAQAGSGSSVLSSPGGGTSTAAAAPSGSTAAAGSGAAAAGSGGLLHATPAESCDNAGAPFKKEGCACRAGETAACWTGAVADRNVGMCHDGLQICNGGSEFASWGPCMGEQKLCGTDAGVPPPPPDDEDCTCIPGAVIQCSEDCTVGIICSLTASKTCQPDGTWSQCHEDSAVTLDLPGLQCRNMLHGCLDILNTDSSGSGGDGELFVGDCSKQFKCGHAPPPVKTPPPTTQSQPDPT